MNRLFGPISGRSCCRLVGTLGLWVHINDEDAKGCGRWDGRALLVVLGIPTCMVLDDGKAKDNFDQYILLRCHLVIFVG